MKQNFVLSVAFYVGSIALLSAGEKLLSMIGCVLGVLGLVFSAAFLTDFLDRIDQLGKIDRLVERALAVQEETAKAVSELRDINRHVCDGFNGLAGIMQGEPPDFEEE